MTIGCVVVEVPRLRGRRGRRTSGSGLGDGARGVETTGRGAAAAAGIAVALDLGALDLVESSSLARRRSHSGSRVEKLLKSDAEQGI
jgi:hypothetical protein